LHFGDEHREFNLRNIAIAERCFVIGGIKNCVLYSEELDAQLPGRDLIANSVRPWSDANLLNFAVSFRSLVLPAKCPSYTNDHNKTFNASAKRIPPTGYHQVGLAMNGNAVRQETLGSVCRSSGGDFHSRLPHIV
jgi:hypothetical protein